MEEKNKEILPNPENEKKFSTALWDVIASIDPEGNVVSVAVEQIKGEELAAEFIKSYIGEVQIFDAEKVEKGEATEVRDNSDLLHLAYANIKLEIGHNPTDSQTTKLWSDANKLVMDALGISSPDTVENQ